MRPQAASAPRPTGVALSTEPLRRLPLRRRGQPVDGDHPRAAVRLPAPDLVGRGCCRRPVMATVHLPRSLVTLFTDPPPRHIELPSTSLSGLVDDLESRWPGMRDRLIEPPGPQLREHINVFID